ncbi:MAG: heme biosynthesis protein HemY [Shimia sp.]
MLWSLLKVLIFFGLVALAAWGIALLTQQSGGIFVTAFGFEAELNPLVSVLALILLMVAIWLVLKLIGLAIATLRFVNGDDTAISRYFSRNRERKGFDALAEGMMALASGEGKVAQAKAAKAERYLNRPELTNIVAAQAAELAGDRSAAEETYKALLKDDRTRFVGVRGLLKQKLADGDRETSLKLAEKAFALKPSHEETQDTLLRLQAQEEDWSGARATLGAKLKHGSLPRDVHRRRDAVMALSEAREMRMAGKIDAAQEQAIEANRLSPELVPAATLAARAYIEQDKGKYAARVLKAAWDQQPHPDLAAAYAAIAPNESAEERLKRFRTLTKATQDHAESKMALAELQIAAEDFPGARRTMGDLAETSPSRRTLTIMAAIARGEGAEDREVRALLTRALAAPPDPAWVCEVCGAVYEDWLAVCEECGAIDSLVWKRPPSAEVQPAATAGMLPLIVGRVEDKRDAEPPTPAPAPAIANGKAEVMDAEEVEDGGRGDAAQSLHPADVSVDPNATKH